MALKSANTATLSIEIGLDIPKFKSAAEWTTERRDQDTRHGILSNRSTCGRIVLEKVLWWGLAAMAHLLLLCLGLRCPGRQMEVSDSSVMIETRHEVDASSAGRPLCVDILWL